MGFGIFFFFFFGRGGGGAAGAAPVGAVPPPALTCTQFSCHSAVTVHLLATEQKHSGTLQKGGGSLSVLPVTTKTGSTDQNSEIGVGKKYSRGLKIPIQH